MKENAIEVQGVVLAVTRKWFRVRLVNGLEVALHRRRQDVDEADQGRDGRPRHGPSRRLRLGPYYSAIEMNIPDLIHRLRLREHQARVGHERR
jgi:hypothetical protein